jgi:hypothetical protein
MFAHVRPRKHCRTVTLIVGKRTGSKVRLERLGRLGNVPWPLTPAGRKTFWAAFDDRWRALEARHPGRLTGADKVKARRDIARHIPPTNLARVEGMISARIRPPTRVEQRETTAKQLSRPARRARAAI